MIEIDRFCKECGAYLGTVTDEEFEEYKYNMMRSHIDEGTCVPISFLEG